MKRIGCKMMVIALAMAMLFTGCNEAVNEEMLTTESETTALESEFVERSEDMVVESQDTELVEVEESEEKSSKEEVTKMEETKTENSKTETTEKKSTNSESSEVVLAPTEDKTSELVTGVINQIITGEMSELEKAKAIHDWMVMNIDYDYQNYINNAIPTTSWHVDGVLTTRYAICDGYAKTFKALCEAAGLECEYVSGNTTEGLHAWNQVKIDGTWYNVDVTWDDPANKAFDDHSGNRYTYFLISDAKMNKDHMPANAKHTCNSSLTEQVMQMYCPWRDYNYIKSADEIPAIVAEYVNTNTGDMLFKIDPNVYSDTELSKVVGNLVEECGVVKNYRKVGIFSNADDWGIRTVIIKFELENGMFTKYTAISTEDELKAEILRIKAIPEYTTMEHGIFVTKDFLEQTGYLSTIEKWLYFDAGLVMECNTYSPQGANIYKARAKFRPVTPEDSFIENAMNDAEVEAIIQDRLARGITTFTVRYYYDPNLTENESFSHAVYEMGVIWSQTYGLEVNGSYQTSSSCFLYFKVE